MTLQLAVRITGDASSLKTSALEAQTAVTGMGTAVEAAGAKSAVAAGKFQQAADAGGAAARAASGAGAGGGTPGIRPQVVPPAPSPSIPPLPPGRRAPEVGFRRDQWQNFGYQGGDILSSGASGASLTQILAQQGPQIVQVLGDHPGGIAGGLKAVASGAMSILTPVRLVAGGIAGLGVTVAALGVSWSRSQDEIQQGLTGIGAKSRATVGDINAIGASLAASGKMSTGEGRGIATQLAAAGNIDVSNIGAVGALAPGYAKMFGKDIDAAGADLARIFSDPVKGAAELDARIGGLDASTKAYVKTLMDQGLRQEAIRVTAQAFASDLGRAAEKTGALAAAWNKLSSIGEAVGKVVAEPFRDNTAQEDLAKAQQEQRRVEGLYGRSPTMGRNAPRVRAAQEATAAAQQRVWAIEAAPGDKAAAERSQAYEGAVKAIRPEIDATETLTSRLKLLTDATGDLNGLSRMSVSTRQALTGAMDAQRGAIETTISAEERARKSQELTIRSIEARTTAEKAAIAEEQKRLDLAGQSIGADDRRRQIEGARAAVLAQSTRESQDRLRGAGATAAAAGLPSYQRRIAELDAKYVDIDKASEGNLPAVANNQKAKAAERRAIDIEAVGGPLREADRAIREQVAGLRLQEAAFGASTEAAAKAAAAQQLINQYTADGVPITENLRRAIEARAAALGKATADQEASLRRQREIVGGLDDIRGSARSGLTGIFSDLSNGKSPVDGIKSALDSMSSKIFDRTVSAPLVNNLLGQDGKGGGGLFGDAVSSIFGKAQAVSTAEINAGVVNVNGAVAGLTGGAAGAANSNVPGAASAAAGLTGSGSSSADAASAITSKLSGSKAEVAEYVRQAAVARGIDPNVATRVVNQESGFNVAATNLTAKEQSYGVMQLNTMGGLGAEAMKAGVDVRDPDAWRSQVDYGMDVVKKDGWRQWYGARDIGVSRWEGIGGTAPATATASATVPAAMPQLQNLDASLQSFSTSTTTAQQSLTGLTGNLTALPGPLSQTSAGLSQVGSSLGSGGGGGLLGALASLLGGGSSASGAAAAAPTVTAATGGHIRGPGTSTSDSINARLSDGEFVVNAKATSQHLPLLHAINNNRRLPAFAEGGVYGTSSSAAAYQAERERRGEPAMGAAPAGGGDQQVHIHGAGTPKSQKRSRDKDGRPRLDLFFDEAVGAQIGTPGSGISRALEDNYGLRRSLVRR